MTATVSTATDADKGYILPPNKIEIDRVKVQMILGSLLIIAVCFLNYFPTLHVGLLLDDFNNVDYAYRAWHGDWSDFLSNFYSNWGHLDQMRSYRPMISVSFFTDYMLFGLNYVGYHVSNIVMFSVCSVLVSLITLELTGMYGNRSRTTAAVWAGLLFAADPLHVESVTWIIGRVDLLCCVFYFASVFTFMRFRLVRERPLLIASLVLGFLAMCSKEMAVVLPVVQTLVCFLPIQGIKYSAKTNAEKIVRSDLKFAALFWGELAIFWMLRRAFIGADIGGYGNNDLKTFLHSLTNFLDKASIGKTFIPTNEELQFPSQIIDTGVKKFAFGLQQVCSIGFGAVFIAAALRQFQSRKVLIPLAFLVLWAGLAVLPTFQIWHIYPNLVGSRLFFTSSAPMCIALALLAIPATDSLGRFATKAWTYIGAAALSVIFVCWSYILQVNLQPWFTAAAQMENFYHQTTELATNLKGHERCLLINLPPDYKGAGLVTRASYLVQICRPPFIPKDYSDKFLSVEPIVFGSHDFLWPSELSHLLTDKEVVRRVIWNPTAGVFEPFIQKPGAGTPAIMKANNFLGATITPASAWSGTDKEWRVQSDRVPGMEIHPEFRRLVPAKIPENKKKKAPVTMSFWLPVKDVNPLDQTYARINMKFNGSDSELAGCKFIWKSNGLNPPSQDEHEATITKSADGKYFVWLGRYRGWILNEPPTSVGLRLPGGSYSVDLQNIELLSDTELKPLITVDGARAQYAEPGVMVKPKSLSSQIHWQVSSPAVSYAVLKISKPNLVFDANSEPDLLEGPAGNVAQEIKCKTLHGSLPLSELNLKEGTTQIQVVAKDKNGDTIGLPSEPVSIKL
ncbi:MAG TPA: hypothetical protein V6C76_16380 [Drouetiella sp.]